MKKRVKYLWAIRAAFEKQRAMRLRELSTKCIRQAALLNSREYASLAIIAYCLHKMCVKEHIVNSGKWETIKKNILISLEKMIVWLKRENESEFNKSMRELVENVELIDRETGNFVLGMMEKAKVKIASTAYSLGLSLSQAASLTGANKKELFDYIGTTRLHDRETVTLDIRERLGKLREQLK